MNQSFTKQDKSHGCTSFGAQTTGGLVINHCEDCAPKLVSEKYRFAHLYFSEINFGAQSWRWLHCILFLHFPFAVVANSRKYGPYVIRCKKIVKDEKNWKFFHSCWWCTLLEFQSLSKALHHFMVFCYELVEFWFATYLMVIRVDWNSKRPPHRQLWKKGLAG